LLAAQKVFYVNFILQNMDVTPKPANKKVGTNKSALSDVFVCSQVDTPQNKSTAKHGLSN
jgi:hypothetical protein